MIKITIFTEPIQRSIKENIGVFKKHVRFFLGQSKYGPSAVLRSLVDGFRSEGIDFNYNPKSVNEIGDDVIVLSDIEALKQAIKLKRSGKIKKLLAGPNLMIWPNEFDGILASREIDICIVPCEWVAQAYEEISPELKGRIRIWYAGVDEKFWQPSMAERSRDVLIYWKTEPEEFIRSVENKLKEFGWDTFRVVYGKYGQDEFKKKLQRSKFAVFVSKSESQGIALAESWSMDVPTLVWDPKKVEINGKDCSSVSSAPYLNDSVGCKWETISDFEDVLKCIKNASYSFRPRQWVLENMTDKASAQSLLKIIYS